MRQYKEYQKTGIEFLLGRKRSLLADDMGLGKTVTVAGALDKIKPNRVLIIALASIKINWMRELREWLNYDFKCQIVNKVKDIIDKELTKEEKEYIQKTIKKDEIIYLADEMLLRIITKLNAREILFSTIYFTGEVKERSTWWGNYNQEYFVFREKFFD